MVFIYKVSKKNINLDINTDNIFICSPCYKYIKLKQLKDCLRISKSPKLKVERDQDCKDTYLSPIEYTKCYICSRFISNILNCPDIIEYIEKSIKDKKPENLMLAQINKLSNWMYHDIIDYFNPFLVEKFKFNRGEFKNINQAITNLDGLPLEHVIISKSEDLYNYLANGIQGNSNNYLLNSYKDHLIY